MRTIATVYADTVDFNHSNALIMYSVTYLARYRGFNTIIIGRDHIPATEKINVVSYISSVPNIIVERWVHATDIAIILSEILHDKSLETILCYGVSCVLAAIPVRKYVKVRIVYIPSRSDISVLEGLDKLLSETYISLIEYSLSYVDLVFDYEQRIRDLINGKEVDKTLFTSDLKTLEKFILGER